MAKVFKRIIQIGLLLFLFKHFYPNAKETYDNTKREMEVSKRLNMIMELLEVKEKVTNNDVQSLLGVSDRTAVNYLDQLEEESKIHQVGDTGRGVEYKKTRI